MAKQVRVYAHAKSSQKKVEEKDGVWHVWVHSPAEKGKANAEIGVLLAKEFHLPKSRVKIVSGETARQKVFELEE